MLSFFRSNQFFVALPLGIYVLVLHLGALSGLVKPVEITLEGGFLYGSLFGGIARDAFFSAATATVLVFLQAFFVNLFCDEFRLMGDRNWFPGLFYALVVSALPDFLFLSPVLVGITFIPFSLWRIYKAFQKPQVTPAIFDGPLWIAVGSLFYPPILWLAIAAFVGYEVVRVFRFNERLVFILGLFTPLFLGWLWYFWADQGAAFRDQQWFELFQLTHFEFNWNEGTYLKLIVLVTILIFALLGMGPLSGRKVIQTQKYFNVLYWFMVLGLVTFFLQGTWYWEHVLLVACPLGILIAYAFQNFRTRIWAEGWHFSLFLLVLVVQYADFLLKPLYSLF